MDTKDQHINQFLIAVATELLRYKTLPKILIDLRFAYPFDSTVRRCDKEYNIEYSNNRVQNRLTLSY